MDKKQARVYEAIVKEIASGRYIAYKSFPVKRKASVAKNAVLKQARAFEKVYSSEEYKGKVFLCVIVSTEEDSLFLDREGNEDTIFIDWFDD